MWIVEKGRFKHGVEEVKCVMDGESTGNKCSNTVHQFLVLCICRQASAGVILFLSLSGHILKVCEQHDILQTIKFHHIYNFGAVGHKDELIRFSGLKIKGQGHSKTTYGHISTL